MKTLLQRTSVLTGLTALAISASTFAAPQQRSIPTEAPLFVEYPGEQEFRGVLVARPLQAYDAALYDLTVEEVEQRADVARERLADLEIERYEFRTDEFFVVVPPGLDEQDLANSLLASGGFQYVEPDWRVYPVICPDDSNFSQQWHHVANLMNSCAAWDIGTGDPNTVVAICDTGLRITHEDALLHRKEGYNAVDQQFENAGGNINPVHPHGTMCLGCAAANGDNGVGIAGVGWNLGHRMMRVSNDSSGGSSIGVLTHAAMMAADLGDKVASVSYSGVTSSGVQSAGAYCRAQGALLVWAAGNSSTNMGGTRDDDVIVVGATDSGDNLASFSSYGSFVDLVAPGVSVYTMDSGSDSDYANVSGTSFSCPLTAGLAGLLFSINPGMTPQEVEDAMRAGCDDLGAAGVDNTFGYGRIDVAASAALVNLPVQIAFPAGQPDYVSPAGGSSLLVDVSGGSDSPVANSGRLYVNTGTGFVMYPMTETSPGSYTGTFPMAPCGGTIDWYVAVDTAGGSTQTSPLDAPSGSYSAIAYDVTVALEDAIEVPGAWAGGITGDTATTGQWTHGDPIGTEAQPESDSSEPGSNCWFTGQGSVGGSLGENDVDGGRTTLVSPTINLAGLQNPMISYDRWYSNNTGASPNADVFTVDMSADGGTTWVNVEVVGPTGAGTGGGWITHTFDPLGLAPGATTVRLRFIAEDAGSGSIVEAAIDQLMVQDFQCGSQIGTPFCIRSSNSVSIDGSSISAVGSTSLASEDVTLRASNAPDQPAVFYFGPDQTLLPFGNGFRCVTGSVVRLPIVMGSAGMFEYSIDFAAYGPALASMGTAQFQCWFRDPAAGGLAFNLSDGLEIVFTP